MTIFLKTSFINITLRGIPIVCKYLLLIFISKYLSLEDLGIYNMFVTTIVIGIFILGFSFDSYTNRELQIEKNKLPLIRDQYVFHTFNYGNL